MGRTADGRHAGIRLHEAGLRLDDVDPGAMDSLPTGKRTVNFEFFGRFREKANKKQL
jgi:hypothetical protein